MKDLFPVELFWVLLAVAGGVARYLASFANGKLPFKLGIFLASAFFSGFSGFMFALFGSTMGFPDATLWVMAGTGGFFGEQTMKLLYETVSKSELVKK